MDAPIEFRLLGPVESVRGSTTLDLGGAKERTLFALLVLDANRVVSVDRLIDELWGMEPPDSANVSLRVLVSHIRKALAVVECEGAIVTKSPGYSLQATAEQIDAERFASLAARGRGELSAGDPHAAAATLRDALGIWRGAALDGLAETPRIAAEASRLEESRLATLENRIEADLVCGRHAALVAETEALTVRHPLREALWHARMLALYRSGRQADALAAYQALRTRLVEDLGIEPSSALAALQRAILSQDPELEVAAAEPRVSASRETGLPTGVVTFLLTDIEASTAAWERDPEAMAKALERHDELIRAFVEGGGGALVKQKGEGDATLAVFRRATEAVMTAQDLQTALRSEPWPGGIHLAVRMAVHTGESHERGGDYYGPTVNRAARLRSLAAGGQIVLSQASAELVRDHLPPGLALTDQGIHELRGMVRGERIYQLASAEVAGESGDRGDAGDEPFEVPYPAPLLPAGTGAFVGREGELEQLTKLLHDASGGERRAALIAGEPGIGKTRLAAELGRRAFEAGALVLYGRCEEDLGIPFQPFVEALRPYVLTCPTGVLRRTAGAPDLALVLPEVSERLPDLAPALRADPDSERLRLFESIASLISGASAIRPVVLFLDDLQWAAKPTLLLLRHLLRSGTEIPLLVVGLYRDTELSRTNPLAEMLADLRREGDMTRVLLSGLQERDVSAFLEAASGQDLDERGTSFAVALHVETEGNPFFMTEVLRHLVESGAVVQEAGRWGALAESPADLGLPEGVREVISRRLSRLSEAANRALAVAAVAGQSFSWRVLEGVPEAGDRPGEVLDALDEAERARLVAEEGAGRFRFTHALIRQTLLEELSTARRIRLHGRVAEALERQPGAETNVEALAYHFGEAAMDGHAEKAADYALLASAAAVRRLAFEEAVTYLEAGLGAQEMAGGDDPERMADLLLALAEAHRLTGDLPAVREPVLRAAEQIRRFRSPPRLARAAMLLIRDASAGVVDPEALALCEEALGQIGDQEPGTRARVLALILRYETWVVESAFDRDRAVEAIGLARDSGDRVSLGEVLALTLWALVGTQFPQWQLELAEELLTIAEEVEDARLAADALAVRAMAHLQLGHRAEYDEAVELHRALGEASRSWHIRGMAAALQAQGAMLDGRFDDAERAVATMAGMEVQDPNLAIAQLGIFLVVAFNRGEADRAVELLDSAIALRPHLHLLHVARVGLIAELWRLDEVGEVLTSRVANDLASVGRGALWPTVLYFLGLAAARVHDREAAAVIKRHLEPYAGQVLVLTRIYACSSADSAIATLQAALGEWDAAERSFAAGLALEEGLGGPPIVTRTKAEWARMLIARGTPGDAARARILLEEAVATADELGMSLVASQARDSLETLAGD